MGLRYALKSVAIVLGAVCVVSLCGCDGVRDAWRALRAQESFAPVPGPVTVVLGSRPPRLVFLDPDTLQVRSELKLRSLAIDIEVAGRYVIVPVCGPPGVDSDTVVGVVDLFRATVDYVDTGRLGPDRVWMADGGWALVMNSEVLEGGMSGFSLDIASRSGVPLTLPHGSGTGAAVGDEAWVIERMSQEDGSLVERVWAFSEGGDVREVVLDAHDVVEMVEVGDSIVLVRGYPGSGNQPELEVFDRKDMSRGVSRVLTEAVGPVRGLSALPNGRVGVLIGANSETDGTMGRLIVVDVETAETVAVIGDLDGPVALTMAGTRTFVLCEGSSELVSVDIERQEVIGRRSVGSEPYDLVDVAYSGG